jgi:hypothetical protein
MSAAIDSRMFPIRLVEDNGADIYLLRKALPLAWTS